MSAFDELVVKRHNNAGAVYSPCEKYRYLLWRDLGGLGGQLYPEIEQRPVVAFIGLNPSTATESQDDPTVRRCMTYAQDWGFTGFYMLNIFTLRSTDPRGLRADKTPNGQPLINDQHILYYGNLADLAVGAWGHHGSYRDRGKYVEALVTSLYRFGVTRNLQPLHPLYLRRDMKPYKDNGNEKEYFRCADQPTFPTPHA